MCTRCALWPADESQILFQHATAGLLRPAWVLIRDDELHTVVLCVRGTQSLKDLFTSLTGEHSHTVSEASLCVGSQASTL